VDQVVGSDADKAAYLTRKPTSGPQNTPRVQ
jgi:hypothetical protein